MNNWEFTDHLLIQLSERKLSIDTVVQGLSEPDEILVGKKNRVIYHKILGNKLLRIIVEDNRIITAYMTSKIKKYLRD
jgi:uncharacterized iron-regulated protein